MAIRKKNTKTTARKSATTRKAVAKKSPAKKAAARKAGRPKTVKAVVASKAKRRSDPVKAAEKALAVVERELGALVKKMISVKAKHDKATTRVDAAKAKAAAKANVPGKVAKTPAAKKLQLSVVSTTKAA